MACAQLAAAELHPAERLAHLSPRREEVGNKPLPSVSAGDGAETPGSCSAGSSIEPPGGPVPWIFGDFLDFLDFLEFLDFLDFWNWEMVCLVLDVFGFFGIVRWCV